MCQQCLANYRKRSFAEFMAKDDELSYLQYKDKKEQLFSEIKGKVVEIGPGTGVNLRFFPKNIHWIGIEPNEEMFPYLDKEAKKQDIAVELLTGNAERTGLADNSVDYVISTIVLCSVENVEVTLKEVLRILKPGGKYIFLEHQADHPWTVRWIVQNIVPYTPWRYFSDGCTPGRQLGKAIENAGFDVKAMKFMTLSASQAETFYGAHTEKPFFRK